MRPLVPHPTTPETAFGVAAGAERTEHGLRLAYRLVGDVGAVRLPGPVPSRRADRLWEHTCFEAFVAPANAPDYVELNVAPSGEWAVYAFTGYRERGPERSTVPEVTVARSADALDVEATLAVDAGPLRVGLTAVIERTDGRKSYWAIRHPAAVPDFHHADGFVLRLA